MKRLFYGFDVEGVILIDKPVGPTSFDVVAKLRRITGQKKIGHAGTLDPLASGLLVICLGRYTKLAGYLAQSSKCYEATVKLGEVTRTDDAEGEILACCDASHVSLVDLKEIKERFLGDISQEPPKFSAIKIAGRRAYARARNDEEFAMPLRAVTIFGLDFLSLKDSILSLHVHCSKGTYVRSLARDIGIAVGVGGHAASIRRTSIGSLTIAKSVKFADLTREIVEQNLLRGQSAVGDMAMVKVTLTEKQGIQLGQRRVIRIENPPPYAVVMFEQEIVALAQRNQEGLAIVRGF